MSLTIVGSLAFDEIITPFGESGKIVGGAALYASLSASNFIKPIHISSVIGNDFPQEELDYLTKRKISYEGVQVIKNKPSFYWKGSYHLNMDSRDTLDTQLNALLDFDPKLPDAYQNDNFLLLGNLDPKIQLNVLKQFKTKPKFVGLDTMNFWMDNSLSDLKRVLKYCDILFVNDAEARQLSGEHSLVKAAKQIFLMGVKYLIIKKGEHGALFFYDDNVFVAPSLPLEDVFDPTGAGDTFAGGFMGYLAQCDEISIDNIKSSIIIGSVMASFCVEQFGITKLKTVSKEKILERINTFIDLVKFDINLK